MSETIRGFSIPFRIDPNTGGVVQASGTAKLQENIVHILLTRIGERVMRRRYGGGLQQLVHDPNDAVLRTLLQHQIARALGEHEPRIQLQQVEVSQHEGVLRAELRYVIRQTQELQALVTPLPLDSVWSVLFAGGGR